MPIRTLTRSDLLAILIIPAIFAASYAAFHWEQWTIWPDKRAALIAALKDPDSAQFRGEHLHGKYLCGEINSKNSMGGYTGFLRFVAFENGYTVEAEDTLSFRLTNKLTDLQKPQAKAAVVKLVWLSGRDPSTITQGEIHRAEFGAIWDDSCSE